jgi:hypothetical protein
MDDLTPNVPSPAYEDPHIHRFLATLPAFGPLPGFEDRVLAQVRVPAPVWLQRTRERTRTVAARRTFWILAGGLATGSAASTAALAILVATRPGLIELTGRWLVAQIAVPAWRMAVGFLSGFWSTLNTLVGTLVPFGSGLAAAAATVAILTLCTWGLYRTMQPGLRARTPFHAHR